MRAYFCKAVRCRGDWESGIIIGPFQMRIARSQFAIWWRYAPLINLIYDHNRSTGGVA